MEFKLLPGGTISGEARVPGDKSMSHRSIMLGALAEGTTRVSGFLEGDDALATLAAFRAMGVSIERHGEGEVVVHGVGLHGLAAPDGLLDLGNAGTGMRLMCGLMAGQPFDNRRRGGHHIGADQGALGDVVGGADRGGEDLGVKAVIVIDLADVGDQLEPIKVDVIEHIHQSLVQLSIHLIFVASAVLKRNFGVLRSGHGRCSICFEL